MVIKRWQACDERASICMSRSNCYNRFKNGLAGHEQALHGP